jgi:dolichyl-phosphate beta-glucosyltransferase
MLHARGRRWLVIDADGATPIAEWEKLEARLEAGADLVIGSRAAPGARVRTPQPWHRRPLGPCFNLLVRAILFRGIRDTQCGFKAYRAETARALCARQRIDGFSFDPETIFLGLRAGWRVEEVGVLWDDRADSKVRVARDALGMLRDLLRVRLYAAAGLYGRHPSLAPGEGPPRSALPAPARRA